MAMQLLFATLLVLAAVAESATLGSAQCTYGPSHWCSSLENAKGCAATQYCMENDWKMLKSQVSLDASSPACDYCKDMIADVKNRLDNNETIATITKYMEKACSYMPDDFASNECQKIAEHYIEEFMDMVRNDIDPEMICQLIYLCPKSDGTQRQFLLQEASVVKPVKVQVQADPSMCDACKQAVAEAKTEVDNAQNQAAAKTFLEGQCAKLGGDLVAECKTLIELGLPQLIAMLDEELSPQLCVMIHMCDNSTRSSHRAVEVIARAKATLVGLLKQSKLKSHIAGVASRVHADECTTCEEVINYVKLFVNNNETEQEVMSYIEDNVCSQLGEFSSMCKEVVEQYFPNIWAQFLTVLDPKTLCTELGFCSNSSAVVVDVRRTSPLTSGSAQCILCEFVIEKLEAMLVKNATEEQIVKAVEKVCSILPSTIQTECDQLVEKYGPAIIHLLISDVGPSTICTALGLCSGQHKKPVAKLEDENCMMCELAVNYVKSALTKNATEEQVMATLEKACAYLPPSLTKQCDSMVETYGPQLLKMLSADMDAKQICTAIGLCSAQAKKADGLVHLYNRVRTDNV